MNAIPTTDLVAAPMSTLLLVMELEIAAEVAMLLRANAVAHNVRVSGIASFESFEYPLMSKTSLATECCGAM
ncbi:hypothetical protein DOTSEDRAFT_71094 [Dothistroma septosporum NZE10]|uniref:Uncharacterized protein n=1 Tax=Dothistroma septosporum (strain NZE10 / CBS 128990) TaxID=675120 RepID=N1PPC5_DOTSN|nr:hypothetical protein DOTSEDRAFT_71094 [Dothistroma septosporum NZE10]